MTLKELLASDAVGCPDDRTGAALNVVEHPRSHGLEVTSEIELRRARLVSVPALSAPHQLKISLTRGVIAALLSRLPRLPPLAM